MWGEGGVIKGRGNLYEMMVGLRWWVGVPERISRHGNRRVRFGHMCGFVCHTYVCDCAHVCQDVDSSTYVRTHVYAPTTTQLLMQFRSVELDCLSSMVIKAMMRKLLAHVATHHMAQLRQEPYVRTYTYVRT